MSKREQRDVVRSTDEADESDEADALTSDRRVLRGARSRRTIVRHAVDVASLEGLDGLSIGRLATDLGISKSGVQTLFGVKENLQVAAVNCARDVFEDAVVRPARTAPRGAARVRALIERWIEYASVPLFPGGCFWAANLAGFDSRPGPVRDVLFRCQHSWRDLIAVELRHAVGTGEIAQLDADLAAFQLDAVLIAANTALRLGDEGVVDKVRLVTEGFLVPPD
ncbi:TetR family transcriptional regulator C-terminal domain-containing protein [Streptomyces piniterrae]|uniref:TetR family transcriptional regulator C-terminal domain-containing protein n=1 Tax=Streptomyces piniterrae TaxID=2571125 RepID=UPI001FE8C0CD|nr:TetR/AcrR family transcriptional regulator [Streptomyces piniterrae]